ncbi:bifunctional 4-hydroxy-2-oxoglutarate aldolase/2-dehydro-3-deoxy-phosphogluconate aldolase [Larkinella soli]|uniref:bifunctional 4-hydroxy-2-oxoglutarate aldolase/2-dehydro-3-deoxy-phosphogluconate aldolase n=1 Tax=Larkinella soli TaxID=1770527 RepID=UPI000FFBFF18|nr:bifunctional 4-hydroxy-2-oxoglutarate aldolase/2-dehydro-3-deoxy-phosphogluconate aldolase [Larkinella soli]
MNIPKFSWARFEAVPLVGILRSLPPGLVRQLVPVYLESGLTTLEITMNTPGAGEMIGDTLKRFGDSLNVGAGTVCTLSDLEVALAAGAQFIVTPVLHPPVIEACRERGIPVFPGAFTPTEIYQAWGLGASMVKVFPAATLGPDYLRQVKAPLDQVRLLPTGGITLDNLGAFRKAGAAGVGVGSPLFRNDLIRAGDWAGLRAHFESFVKALAL